MGYDLLHGIQTANDTLPAEKIWEEKGHQIALSNIQRRLQILYGEQYGFQITSQLLKGTRVTLRIPCCLNETGRPDTADR